MQRLLRTIIMTALLLTSWAGITQAQTAVQISPFRFDVTINPGESKVDTIKVTNQGSEPQTFQLTVEDFYAADEFGKPSFRVTNPDERYSVSSWITPGQDSITIPGNTTQELQFFITVPESAEPGGHYGALFFSPPQDNSGQVAIQGRIGALLLINVRGEVEVNTTLETFGAYAKDVDFSTNTNTAPLWFFDRMEVPFALRLQNTGTVHSRPTGTIEIYDMWGKKLENIGIEKIVSGEGVLLQQDQVDYLPVNPEQGVVLPETFRTFRDLTWDGFVYERFNSETGRVELIKQRPWMTIGQFRAVLTLELNGQTITREVSFWIIPWQSILLIVLSICILFLLVKFGLTQYRKSIEARFHTHSPVETR